MNNKEFDHIIKEKLSHIESESSVSDWAVFSKILKTEPGFEGFDFDEVVKEKLSRIDVVNSPSDWAVFSEILRAEPGYGNFDFDEVIKNKLSNIDSDNSPADWAVFSEILKSDTAFNDLQFDQNVSEKFEQHRSSFNSNHWLELQKRLKKEENVRKHLISSKAVEILCLFLLLFTFDNLMFNSSDAIYDNTAYAEMLSQKEEATSKLEQNNIQLEEGTSKVIIVNELIQSGESIQIYEPAFSSKNEQTKHLSSELPSDGQKINSDLLNILTEMFNFQNQNIQDITPDVKNQVSIESVEMNEMVLHKNVIRPMILPNFKPQLKKDDIKYHLTPTYAMGMGINRAPFDEVYWLNPHSSVSNTTKTGLLFSAEHKDFEFSTGIEVERRSITAQKHTESFNGNNYSLNKIGLSTVSIPLGVKYSYPITKKVKMYANASLGVNAVLTAKYDRPIDPIVESVRGGRVNTSRANEPQLHQKDFTDGILQGGNYLDNFYLTANGEFGLESKINDKQSVVAGVGYNRFIHTNGIGPNKDRLDFAFARIGLKYQLN